MIKFEQKNGYYLVDDYQNVFTVQVAMTELEMKYIKVPSPLYELLDQKLREYLEKNPDIHPVLLEENSYEHGGIRYLSRKWADSKHCRWENND